MNAVTHSRVYILTIIFLISSTSGCLQEVNMKFNPIFALAGLAGICLADCR